MKKSVRIILGLVIVILLIVGGYNLLAQNNTPKENLKIGVISGLSGQYSVVGQNFVDGINLAYDDYMVKNPEAKIKLIVEDDAFEQKQGLSAYKKLTEFDQVDALINVSSVTINTVYDEVKASGLPVMQMGEQGQDPTDDNVIQVMPGNIFVEKEMGKYVQKQGFTSPVMVYSNEPTYYRFAQAAMEGYGNKMPEFALDMNQADFSTDALKIMDKNPDVIIFVVMPDQGAKVIKELIQLGKNKPAYIFDGNLTSGYTNYQKILGNFSYLENDKVFTIPTEFSDDFKKAYKEKFNREPGFVSDWGYDAFMVLMENYDKDKAGWLNNIKMSDSEGVSGNIKFDKVGVRIPQIIIQTFNNGELR